VEHHLSFAAAASSPSEQAASQVTPSSIVAGRPAESGASTKEEGKRESLTPLLTESGNVTAVQSSFLFSLFKIWT